MPDPPHVGLLTRHVLESPLPAGILLLVLGTGLAWSGLRAGRRERLRWAAAAAVAGAALILTGAVIVTAGERAKRLTGELLEAAVAGDVDAASACFADDATLAFGRATNPGYERGAIEERLGQLAGRYRIRSNRVLSLRSYTESRQSAVVHLSCATVLEMGVGPVRTQWVLDVERMADGSWKVRRVTWITIEGAAPSPGLGL